MKTADAVLALIIMVVVTAFLFQFNLIALGIGGVVVSIILMAVSMCKYLSYEG